MDGKRLDVKDFKREWSYTLGHPHHPQAPWSDDSRRASTSALLREHLKDKPLPARLQELARFQSEQGYMAETSADDSGRFCLVKYNCAICIAARQHPAACCAGEMPLLKELLGEVEIVQETAILDGNHTCTFRIRDSSQKTEEA